MLVAWNKKEERHAVILGEGVTLETAGYDAITSSSYPPYGPRVKAHGGRVMRADGAGSLRDVRDVRKVPPQLEAELVKLGREIEAIVQRRREMLDEAFLTLPLAQAEDFRKVHPGYTKDEAQARLPSGEAAKSAARQGRELSRELGRLRI